MPRPASPASGERRAAGGLRPQYALAAVAALRALRDGDLVEVRVTDPEAGATDDAIIVREHRVDAYQVKWDRYAGTVTLRDLTVTRDGPSLIAQLADGWRRLRAAHPTRRVVVHLLTNAVPSATQRVADGPTPGHLAAFLAEAWVPARSGGVPDLDGPWAAPWQSLRDASGLDDATFAAFVDDCALDLAAPAPPDDADRRALAAFLFETAAAVRHEVALPRRELLDRLGWTRRFAPLNRHEFDVPRFYRPIARTADAVYQRLAGLSGGYLAVVGPPGSGKSTLLTRTLQGLRLGDRPARLVRYYAFVRETQGATAVRGESAHFLHDVTLRLQDADVCRTARRPEPGDRAALLALFYDQIADLGREYAETGTHTVLLVDGLDHIEREQAPDRSLLHDLPRPHELPDGVHIVLGTQRTDLTALPPDVRRAVEENARRVEMAPLTPGDVAAITHDVVPGLTADQADRVAERSAGHPLALVYLLRRLQRAEPDERDGVLDTAVPYADDIDADYDAHWRRVAHEGPIVHALALLARVRGPIDTAWAAGWMGNDTAHALARTFGPYFDRDSAGRWTFFHNSFRLFLQARTAQPPLGGDPEPHVRALHRELAGLYAAAPGPTKPDALYHLVEAGEDAAALALATTDFFLAQVRTLRPLDAVQADVRRAVLAAGRADDPLALVRLLLVAADLDQRANVLEGSAAADHLLDLGDTHAAAETVRDGDRLRVSDPAALALAVRLADAGLAREGVRVFELAAPYDTLAGTPLPTHGASDDWETVRAWADAAPRFLRPDDAVARVRLVRYEPDPHPHADDVRDPDEASASVQAELLSRLAAAAAARGAWADWRSYLRAFLAGGHDPSGLLLDSADATYNAEPEAARRLVDMVLRRHRPTDIGDDLRRALRRLTLAELALEHDPEAADAWTADLLPLPVRAGGSLDRGPSRAAARLRLYRLRYTLGETREPGSLVSADTDATGWGEYQEDGERGAARRLALAVSTIGALWGRARRGDRIPPSAFLREAGWSLRAFDEMPARYSVFYEAGTSRAELLAWAAHAAAAHGSDVADALVDRLAQRWDGGRGTPAEARAVGAALAEEGADGPARRALGYGEAGSEPDVWARVEAERELADAYFVLGDDRAARQHLAATVDAARGTLDKHDHQLEVWVRWMAQANAVDPGGAYDRVRLMLRRVVAVKDQSRNARAAAHGLVLAVARWSPRRAVPVLTGLLERGALHHDDGLLSLLRGALDGPDGPADAVLHAVRHLVIPFGRPGDDGTVVALLGALADVHGHQDAARAARYLAEGARAEALPSDRRAWLRAVAAGLEALGLPMSAAGIVGQELAQEEPDDNRLSLSDGRELTLAEALATLTTVSDFDRLVALRDPEASGFYRWRELADRAARLASTDEIEALAATVETVLDDRAAVVIATLSGRARSAGRGGLADRLAQRALNLSDPMGWDPYYDGGSRLAAFEALRDADPAAGRRAAVERLADDIGRGRRGVSPHRLIHHAERLLPLLFEDVPTLDVWDLVEHYLDSLFASTPHPPVLEIERRLDALGPAPDRDIPDRAVADAVAAYLDIPSPNVAARAVAATAATLAARPGDAAWTTALHDVVSRSEEATARVLTALLAVSDETPEAVAPFEDVLQDLETHPNLFLRSRAAQIRARVRRRPLAVALVDRPVSAIYDLEFPDRSVRRDAPAVVLDPARRLRPLDIDVRSIADAAGVDEEAALARAGRLAEQFTPERSWLPGGDPLTPERLSGFLDGAGLRVAFRKPHIAAAERAVAHVAGELYDDQRLAPGRAAFFARWLTGDDPDLVLRSPRPRPSWVDEMGGVGDTQDFYTVPDGWLDAPHDSLERLRPFLLDGRAVLAERSRFAYLGTDDRMEEVRSSAYHTGPEGDDADPDDPWTPFENAESLRVADYPTYRGRGEPVVHAPSRRAETPGIGWIAISPALASRLGWSRDPSGLFRWRGAGGDVAVETVWWTDGLVERYDSRTRDVVGEGWAVLASPSALRAVLDCRPDLDRWGTVTRQLGFRGFGEVRAASSRLTN